MPRTLDATLEAALDSGSFQPYFLLTVREVGFGIIETATPTYFKLSGINLTAKWVRQSGSVYTGFTRPNDFEFKITRGVTIAGVNYTTDSSYYYGVSQVWDGVFQTVNACMLPALKYTAAGDVTYKTVIDAICSNFGKTAVYDTVGAAWQSYKFLGAGKVLTLNRSNTIINMIKQKYIIYACDNGSDQIRFKAVGTDSNGSADYTMPLGKFKEHGGDVAGYRRFLYRDEANTIHYSGDADDPLWNLGYLESTASAPTTKLSYPFVIEPIAPHLKYLTFDTFTFTFATNYPPTGSLTTTNSMWVEEEYNYEFKELGWRIYLSNIDWAKGTEGGALPGTIEAAAPYTPLNTSSFAGILDANDNNIQAAMETIDDHHSGIAPAINAPTAIFDFLVGEQVATVWTWVRKTLAQTITILRTSLDSIYSAAAHTHEVDQRADMWLDSEGDPANVASAAADGTSAYGARRDHIHKGALNAIVLHATHMQSTTVPASTTYYAVGYIDGFTGTTERSIPVLRPGTVKNLYVRQVGAQPASGNIVITIRKTIADTAITITIAAGSAGPATRTDITHSVAVVAGDLLGISFVNNATGASCTFGFVAFEIECDP